jgi:hypothetical protein
VTLAEDADDMIAVDERHGADLDGDAIAVGIDDDNRASVTFEVPMILRANSSFARRVSSGATTLVNCRPPTSPTMFRAARFTQRMTPPRSMT